MAPRLTNIIDTHIHFWHPDKVKIPWMKGTPFETTKDAEEYSQQVQRIGVQQGIYVETDVDARHGLVEAAWIRDYVDNYRPRQDGKMASASFGGITGVVAFAPVDQGEHVRSYLQLLQRLVGKTLLRGVRYLLQDATLDPRRMVSPDFVQGVRILGEEEFKLMFEMVIDCHRCPEQFPALIELVSLCPDVSFVLDHMGKPPCQSIPGSVDFDRWASCMKQLAQYPNVVMCKVSGLITELEGGSPTAKQLGPFVQVAKDVFGIDRLCFGGDWPICDSGGSWQIWVDVLQEIVQAWSPEEQIKLFITNAQRCYQLV
ncbi:uncharacterized protein BX664DRAFT_13760 [Halteromyces radiatus]|uniref:uncharacterized protein n=1 Tax=Halteromyces radiatus TaxID=101107 RepID=UPI00221EA920|nr:uncharacterized protein BX664DRAFT_13760 [Halteromyces radiatus]KAI8099140.1 hypothetical protein BX664DRAFT_13760 [Halteromyces radiatus]